NVDCDDALSVDYVEKLVAALEAVPSAGLAYGVLRFCGAVRNGEKSWPDRSFRRERMYLENVIPGPGTMIRAAALAQTAGWRSEFGLCSGEDYDIWLQVVEAGWHPLWVQDAIYHYFQHEASFLARARDDTQLEVALNILALHSAHIRRA